MSELQIAALIETLERLKNAVRPVLKENFDASEISAGLCKTAKLEDRLDEYYKNVECPVLFSEFMNEDPSSWPKISELDDKVTELSEEHKKVKTEISKLKGILEENLELPQRTYGEFEETLVQLEKKIQNVEKKSQMVEQLEARKIMFEKLQKSENDLERKREKIMELKEKLQKEKSQHEKTVVAISVEKDLQERYAKKVKQRKEAFDRIRDIKAKLQHLNGLVFHPSSPSTIKVEFTDKHEARSDPKLYLTLEFEDGKYNCHLTGAKVNIDSLPIDDLVEAAVRSNNIPLLVTTVRQRWQTHFPLAQEMLHIAENHAVDWIRDEGLVRVLVGMDGSIICTLSLPSTYPSSGEITLQRIGGTDVNVQDVIPPKETRHLKDWVLFLEERFGSQPKSKEHS